MDSSDYRRRIEALEQRVNFLEQTIYQHQTQPQPQKTVSEHKQQKVSPFQTISSPQRTVTSRMPQWNNKYLLTVLGGIITLFGFGFILMLSIKYNWLTPQTRVALLTVVSTVLIAASFYARRIRKFHLNLPTIFAATGISGLYITVLAAHTIYEWLNLTAAIILTAAVTVLGAYITSAWTTRGILIANTIGVTAVAALILNHSSLNKDSYDLIFSATILLIYLANMYPIIRNKWNKLHFVNMLYLMIPVIMLPEPEKSPEAHILASDNIVNGGTFFTAAYHNVFALLFTIIAVIFAHKYLSKGELVIPLLLAQSALYSMYPNKGAAVALLLLVLTVVAAVDAHRSGKMWNVKAYALGGSLYLLACFTRIMEMLSVRNYQIGNVAIHADDITFLAYMIIVLAAAVTAWKLRIKVAYYYVLFSTGLIVIYQAFYANPFAVLHRIEASQHAGWLPALSAVLVCATIIIAARLVYVNRKPGSRMSLRFVKQFAVTTFLLYSATATVYVSMMLNHTNGYYAGHLITTMLWFAVAIYLIYSKKQWADRFATILLIVSTAKLFLFDLNTLDGVLRAVLFVAVGLSILAVSYMLSKNDTKKTNLNKHEENNETVLGKHSGSTTVNETETK